MVYVSICTGLFEDIALLPKERLWLAILRKTNTVTEATNTAITAVFWSSGIDGEGELVGFAEGEGEAEGSVDDVGLGCGVGELVGFGMVVDAKVW